MRDIRFKGVHRGGLLTKEQHCQLIIWACDCAEHILILSQLIPDPCLIDSLTTAREWKKGNASTGDARKAAVKSFALARESSNPVLIAAALSVGHAAATAHMADHSTRAADYALKTVNISGKSVENERKWQNEHLPAGVKELVLSAREMRYFKILPMPVENSIPEKLLKPSSA
jgi:hypothetical protein